MAEVDAPANGTRKFALLSHVLPPSPSGQAVVLYRLLRDLDPRDYCLISVHDYAQSGVGSGAEPAHKVVSRRLAAPYHATPRDMGLRLTPHLSMLRGPVLSTVATLKHVKERLLPRRQNHVAESPDPPFAQEGSAQGWSWKDRCKSWLIWAEDAINLRHQINARARHLVRTLRQEKCGALIACSGDLIDLPAGCQAARQLRVPFYVYLFDDFVTQFELPHQKDFAERLMPRLLRQACGVAVPNEFLARAYRDRYGVDPWIIRNPIEPSQESNPVLAAMGQPVRIIYTGAVYQAHYDAFLRLLSVVRNVRTPSLELHIYTPMTKAHLEKNLIRAPAIVHDAVSTEEATRLQKSADILFLPLAFDSPLPELVNTSAPGKMGELLASGRPILVHAPKDSFVSWYFRKHNCGAVVDEKDPLLLQQAIQRLVADPDYCRGLVLRAGQRAASDFALRTAQATFLRMLQSHEVAA